MNQATPTSRTIKRLPAVKEAVGLSTSQIYAMMADGRFPKPIKLSTRAVGWPADVIEKWLADRANGLAA